MERKMIKLEYIWIDGSEPAHQVRSKTKVIKSLEWDRSISGCPVWGFDGSSTEQAEGNNSDCVLKPVRIYPNPLESSTYQQGSIVFCEVWNVDDTPHPTNARRELEELLEDLESDIDEWVGFEQEYTLYKNGRPLGWPFEGEPLPQGDYYCGRNKGDWIARRHMDYCIKAGLKICGINSEVMLGQWEFQIGFRGDENETFCFTYGDSLNNADISSIIKFHKNNGKLATVTACHPPEKYGVLKLENDLVTNFDEKPERINEWVSIP